MNDLNFPRIRSSLLSQFPNLVFGMSTRQGEVADAPFGFNLGFEVGDDEQRVTTNLARFTNTLGTVPEHLAFMNQVHGANIREISEAGIYPATNAMITRHPRLGLVVRTADCVPIVMYAPANNIVAAVHAGWRGTAEHIAKKTVRKLIGEYDVDPSLLYIYLGPAAGPCCYEVGSEVAALFNESVIVRGGDGNAKLDLKAANVAQLREAGIPDENIDADPLCTITEHTLLHSWRRDGDRSGRMLSIIFMKEEL